MARSHRATIERNKGKSLTIIPENYTLVDIETTGLSPRYDEIIEIACIKIRNGQEYSKYTSLIQPQHPIPYHIQCMTGITNEMVSNAPRFSQVSSQIWNFLKDELIVGHNVNFDINFLYDNIKDTTSKILNNDYVDTLRLSRKVFPEFESHGLMSLAFEFDIHSEHHRAVSDCYITMDVLKHIAQEVADKSIKITDLFTRKQKKEDLSSLDPDTLYNDKEHIFYDKNCVFTGKLEEFNRKEAAQIVVNIGGHCENSITKKTNFLIVGDMDYKSGLDGHKSTKLTKAENLIAKGQNLQIIPESTFYDLVADYITD